jgi:hypothetical protein
MTHKNKNSIETFIKNALESRREREIGRIRDANPNPACNDKFKRLLNIVFYFLFLDKKAS